MKRPGGEVAKRYLDLHLLLDKSASMNESSKISSLNTACREAMPFIKSVQDENPGALIRMNVLTFSHGAEWVTKEPIPVESYHWTDIKADEIPTQLENGNLEIVFLIDTSGSMSTEIEAVKQSCVDFANTIEKQGLNVKLGLVGFDIGGYRGANSSKFKVHNLSHYTIGVWELSSPSVFKENIRELSVGIFGGAGCYLANSDTVDIFPHVAKVYSQQKVKRVLVVISDEIGSGDGLHQIVRNLNDASITSYVLGVSSGEAHKQIAKLTGGEFWDIHQGNGKKDFSSLLVNTVAESIGREAKKTLKDGTVSQGTDIGEAIKLLTRHISMDKMPARCLPPISILVSDGLPTDDFRKALSLFNAEPWAKKMVRLAIAIGDDCDLSVMQDFIGNPEIKPLKASNSSQLVKYFKWASTVVLRKVSTPMNGGRIDGVIDVPRYVETIPEPENKIVW